MTRREYRFEPLDIDDIGDLKDHYQAVRAWLVQTSERDVRHNLPNLVETIADASSDPETVRFLGGVSFTQNHTPLDYRVDRFYETEEVDFLRRDPMKLPVSQDHHYIRFVYPADPKFDGGALRAALLSAIETALYSFGDEEDEAPSAPLSDLWQDL